MTMVAALALCSVDGSWSLAQDALQDQSGAPAGGGGLRGGGLNRLRGAAAPATADAVDFESILRRPIKVDFADTPLSDVVDFFSDHFDINIRLDHKGLTDAAVDPSAPVTCSLRKPISFESALRLILEEFDLTLVIQDEVVKITSKEKADEILTAKVYAVGDLLDRGPRRQAIDPLIATITSTIQPDSWDDNGGPGSISRVASTLVISQKRDVHTEIQDLLVQLRAQLPKKPVPDATTDASPRDDLTTMVYKLEHASGKETLDAITQLIAPASWRPDGGAIAVVSIKEVMHTDKGDVDRSWDALLVRQKDSVQEEIQAVLDELGRLRGSAIMLSSGAFGGLPSP